MNSSVFSLLLATLALFRVATAGGDCDVDGYVYNSVYQTCVKAYTSSVSFNDAEDVCIGDGGNLLSIHSAMDQAVFDIIDYPVTWVGLMYDFSHSWFEWTDGSEVDYNPLASIPVNYGCTTLTKNSAGGLPLWYDSSCDNVNAPFICALPSKGLTQQTWMPSGGMETSQSDGWTGMSMVSMASSDMPMGSSDASDMPTMETMQPTWAPETTTSRATRLMTTTTPTTTTTTTTTQRPPQTTPTQGPPGKCPAGWLTSAARQNTCYYVYDAAVVDYFNALRFCQNLHANSHVLVIHNGFENSEVRDLITTSTVWLGLDSGSGTWAWSDGETSSYTNWATGQPSSDNSCSVLNRSTGKWSTVDCDSRLPLICQLYF